MKMDDSGFLMLSQARGPDVLKQFSNILLWGAGHHAARAISGFEPGVISSIYDNDSQKWGENLCGIPICSPEHFSIDKNTAVIISASKYMDDIARELVVKHHVSEEQIFPLLLPSQIKRTYLPDLICKHRNELEQVWGLLADEESKQYFSAYLNAVLTMNPLCLVRNPNITGAYVYQSQRETVAPKAGDCIVDCGAFIGDTMECFMQLTDNNCKFYGLEPVSGNYKVLLQTIKKYPNVCAKAVQCAVGKEVGKTKIASALEITMQADVLGTYENSLDAKKEMVPVETLDHLFKTETVDYIKMDIEGEEVNALLGSQNIIKRDKPTMMLSAYHMINHMWEIPLLVHKFDPAYRIYCGHQPTVCFEPEFYCIRK